MKRIVSVLLMVSILLLLCPMAIAESYKVTLDINFVSNLVFSRYDVDMYYKSMKLAHFKHGEDYKGSFFADEGSNTLYFCKSGDTSVQGVIRFDVKGDTTISCKLYCHNNKINLKNVNVKAKTTKTTPISSLTATNTPSPTPKPTNTPSPTPELTNTPSPTSAPTDALTPSQEPVQEPITDPAESLLHETKAETIATEEPTQKPVTFADIDLQSMTDEELANAAAAIKAEQRVRIKTKIVLDKTEATLFVGKNDKITASVKELPEGEKVPKMEWSSSDKKIVTVNNGQIRAVTSGNSIVTCSATLSDGTYIYSECKVKVIVPVASIAVDNKNLVISAGNSFSPKYTIRPDNASVTGLTFESSNPNVATVSNKGVINGIAAGKATITAKATDGSGKSVVINVSVKNDGYMKNTKGQDLFNRVISGESVNYPVEGGSNDWYDRDADIGGISFEVHSKGKNGQVVSVEVLDIMNTGNRRIFFKVLDNLFSGDDLKKATDWVKRNLGREAQLQIGDAYIILQLTTTKSPIMYIQDEEHKDWV